MEKDTTRPILSGDCDSSDTKRVRMADLGSTVDRERRPVKLQKLEENGILIPQWESLISHLLFFNFICFRIFKSVVEFHLV